VAKIFGTNFENLKNGRYSKTLQKFLTKFPGLATSGRHYRLYIAGNKFTTKLTFDGMSIFHFYRYNQFKVFPLG